MAKKAAAKTTKKTTKKAVKSTTVDMASATLPVMDTPVVTAAPKSFKLPSRLLPLALIVVGIALLTYKVGPYFVPAIVGSTPVTRFEIWNRLEKSYGAQALDDVVNEKILDSAIAKSGVKVDQAKVDEQVKALETQFESLGGLDAALEQRGMTRSELTKQVKTQLAVEEILKDKVNPKDDEVKAAFDEAATTTYKDKKFEDVKDQVRDELVQTKLVEAFRNWFETIKAEAKLKNFGL
jgi:parvulin-like peptidyl-prolyl isomerase